MILILDTHFSSFPSSMMPPMLEIDSVEYGLQVAGLVFKLYTVQISYFQFAIYRLIFLISQLHDTSNVGYRFS